MHTAQHNRGNEPEGAGFAGCLCVSARLNTDIGQTTVVLLVPLDKLAGRQHLAEAAEPLIADGLALAAASDFVGASLGEWLGTGDLQRHHHRQGQVAGR